jgi:hypothetical protein
MRIDYETFASSLCQHRLTAVDATKKETGGPTEPPVIGVIANIGKKTQKPMNPVVD